MRPQDSLPFMRRISSDQRRSMQATPAFSLADALAAPATELTAPAPAFAREEPQGRTSFDSGYSAGDERGTVRRSLSLHLSPSTAHDLTLISLPQSPEPVAAAAAAETSRRPHSFVRSSFSKGAFRSTLSSFLSRATAC